MSEEEDLESQNSESGNEAHTVTDSGSGDEFVARGYVNAYQDEPIAMAGENELRANQTDEDGILPATLDARLEGTIPLDDWCKCTQCRTDLLEGAREHRCCWEVGEAMAKLMFDGSIEKTPCITLHQDFIDLTKRVVLQNVGPLLRDKQGRSYRQRAGQDNDVYLRAVAYRWLVRWIFSYLGWDNSRPLPACIYNKVRTDFSTGQAHGYSSSLERA